MKIDSETAAIVTGGASGLGRASAEALVAAGVRTAIFDWNADGGAAAAAEIGADFYKVDITDEESVIAGFDAARGKNGQERILVHCAQTSRGRMKTVGRDRETGGWKRYPTEDYEYSIKGILVASYRLASLSALGMADLPELEDGERGVITLTSSAAAQDAQMGQIGYGSGKAGVNGLVLPMARLDESGYSGEFNHARNLRNAANVRSTSQSVTGLVGFRSLPEATWQSDRVCQPRHGAGAKFLL